MKLNLYIIWEVIILENMKSDLLYVFKKLYEKNKITKDEYIRAINKII